MLTLDQLTRLFTILDAMDLLLSLQAALQVRRRIIAIDSWSNPKIDSIAA